MTAAQRSASLRPTLAALALAAIALYAPLVGWGLPHATAPGRIKTFAPDEILPLEALAEMRSTFVSPAPDRNFGYPWWHYFVVASIQAPYLAVLKATGSLSDPSPIYPFGLRDPVRTLEVLTIIGRLVSVVMGAGIVVASFFFARVLWDHRTGVVAAVLTMVNFLMVYYSRTGNLDVPAFFWTAIGMVIFATILVRGLTLSRAVWLGLFAALGIATKDQSVAIFLPLCLVLLLPRFNHTPGQPYRLRPLVIATVASIAVYLVATGMIVDPRRHVTHVYSLFFDPGRLSAAAAYSAPSPRTWSAAVDLGRAFGSSLADMMSLPVLIVAVAGWMLATRRNRWHVMWLLPFATIFVLLIWLTGHMILRYLLPLTLFVDAFAAFALIRLRDSPWRVSFVPVLIVLVGVRVAAGLDLTYAQLRETRYQAADWLKTHYRTGDRIEFFGVAETLPALDGVMVSRRIMGRTDWVRESGHGPAVLDYLTREGPTYVIVVPDWTSPDGMEHSADCPPEVYAALVDGSAGYTLAVHFTPPALMPPFLRQPVLDHPSVAPPVRIFSRRDGNRGDR